MRERLRRIGLSDEVIDRLRPALETLTSAGDNLMDAIWPWEMGEGDAETMIRDVDATMEGLRDAVETLRRETKGDAVG